MPDFFSRTRGCPDNIQCLVKIICPFFSFLSCSYTWEMRHIFIVLSVCYIAFAIPHGAVSISFVIFIGLRRAETDHHAWLLTYFLCCAVRSLFLCAILFSQAVRCALPEILAFLFPRFAVRFLP